VAIITLNLAGIGEAGEGLVGVAGLGPGILMNIIRPIIMITTSTIATRYKVFLKAKRYHL
jgi:hypothetical protein